jgi:hypothetical protein
VRKKKGKKKKKKKLEKQNFCAEIKKKGPSMVQKSSMAYVQKTKTKTSPTCNEREKTAQGDDDLHVHEL